MSYFPTRGAAALAVLAAVSLALSACDGGPSAVRTASSGSDAPATIKVDHRQDPTPMLDGKPMWAANRKHGAEDNARYHFERDGKAFGADNVDAYVRTAQAFIAAPPKGAEVIKRSNGDRLIYDPASNVFAVATSEGAPRAMFKPKDGAAYWAKQKAAGADRQTGRRRSGDGKDDGAASGDDRQG